MTWSDSSELVYYHRITQVLDFIDSNLDKSITVLDLAREAYFSPFHFQRIFKSILHETPYELILRRRLEKGARLLVFHPRQRVRDIALEVGFPNAENFTRQFKSRYSMSPSQFRKAPNLVEVKKTQEVDFQKVIEEVRKSDLTDFQVEVETLPAIPVYYCRAIFGSDGSELLDRYQSLIRWADRNELPYKGPMRRFGMSIDHPSFTPPDKYRYDFAIRSSGALKTEGFIEQGMLAGGKYATIHVQGDIHRVAEAWEYLYRVWLPSSQTLPADHPSIEEFIQGPEDIGWDVFNLKCRLPVN